MARLLLSEQIAGAADLEVPHCDLESGTEFRKFANSCQTFFRNFFQLLVPAVHQESVSCSVGAADSAPELIQLGEAHAVGIVDDNGVGI